MSFDHDHRYYLIDMETQLSSNRMKYYELKETDFDVHLEKQAREEIHSKCLNFLKTVNFDFMQMPKWSWSDGQKKFKKFFNRFTKFLISWSLYYERVKNTELCFQHMNLLASLNRLQDQRTKLENNGQFFKVGMLMEELKTLEKKVDFRIQDVDVFIYSDYFKFINDYIYVLFWYHTFKTQHCLNVAFEISQLSRDVVEFELEFALNDKSILPTKHLTNLYEQMKDIENIVMKQKELSICSCRN